MKEQFDAIGRKLPVSKCVVCGYQMNAATSNQGEHRPQAGNFTLCAFCGEIYKFDDNMSLRVPTINELVALDKCDLELLGRIQLVIRKERVINHDDQ